MPGRRGRLSTSLRRAAADCGGPSLAAQAHAPATLRNKARATAAPTNPVAPVTSAFMTARGARARPATMRSRPSDACRPITLRQPDQRRQVRWAQSSAPIRRHRLQMPAAVGRGCDRSRQPFPGTVDDHAYREKGNRVGPPRRRPRLSMSTAAAPVWRKARPCRRTEPHRSRGSYELARRPGGARRRPRCSRSRHSCDVWIDVPVGSDDFGREGSSCPLQRRIQAAGHAPARERCRAGIDERRGRRRGRSRATHARNGDATCRQRG